MRLCNCGQPSYRSSRHSRDCRECHRARSREWWKKNKHKYHEYHLRERYGITPERYSELLVSQGGVCAICKEPGRKKRLCVDHDHRCCPGEKSCGECTRGLL